jgi:hypothetical protein
MTPFDLMLMQYHVLDVSVAVVFFVASFSMMTTVLLTD